MTIALLHDMPHCALLHGRPFYSLPCDPGLCFCFSAVFPDRCACMEACFNTDVAVSVCEHSQHSRLSGALLLNALKYPPCKVRCAQAAKSSRGCGLPVIA
jgi:hypothetical protein